MKQHLRIEAISGEVRLLTPDGRTLTPDVLTVKIERGRVVRMKLESRDEPPEFLSCKKFFANGGE